MFKFLSKKKSWFTLVEMLIVIVIIWLLAASLIPKLTGVQAKARDTVRRTDLSQLWTAVSEFYTDNGTYPWVSVWWQSSDHLSGDMAQYLKSLPKDPQNSRIFNGIEDDLWGKTPWYYMYAPIKRNGIANASFALMAGMENVGWADNRVYDAGITFNWGVDWEITTWADFLDLVELTCVRVSASKTISSLNTWATEANKCKAKEKEDNLRYLYIN